MRTASRTRALSRLPCSLLLHHRVAALATASGSAPPSGSVPPADAPPRPFRVLGVQQIAVGALQKADALRLWVDALGLPIVGTFRSERENVDEDILVAGVAGSPWAVEVDVMQPLDATRAPRVHEPALNHVGLWVDDLAAAHAWLRDHAGVRFAPGGVRKGAAGHDVCFIHPRPAPDAPVSGAGVLVELVQAPRDVRDAYATLEAATAKGRGSA